MITRSLSKGLLQSQGNVGNNESESSEFPECTSTPVNHKRSSLTYKKFKQRENYGTQVSTFVSSYEPKRKRDRQPKNQSLNMEPEIPAINVHVHLHTPNGNSPGLSQIQPIIHVHLKDINDYVTKAVTTQKRPYKRKKKLGSLSPEREDLDIDQTKNSPLKSCKISRTSSQKKDFKKFDETNRTLEIVNKLVKSKREILEKSETSILNEANILIDSYHSFDIKSHTNGEDVKNGDSCSVTSHQPLDNKLVCCSKQKVDNSCEKISLDHFTPSKNDIKKLNSAVVLLEDISRNKAFLEKTSLSPQKSESPLIIQSNQKRDDNNISNSNNVIKSAKKALFPKSDSESDRNSDLDSETEENIKETKISNTSYIENIGVYDSKVTSVDTVVEKQKNEKKKIDKEKEKLQAFESESVQSNVLESDSESELNSDSSVFSDKNWNSSINKNGEFLNNLSKNSCNESPKKSVVENTANLPCDDQNLLNFGRKNGEVYSLVYESELSNNDDPPISQSLTSVAEKMSFSDIIQKFKSKSDTVKAVLTTNGNNDNNTISKNVNNNIPENDTNNISENDNTRCVENVLNAEILEKSESTISQATKCEEYLTNKTSASSESDDSSTLDKNSTLDKDFINNTVKSGHEANSLPQCQNLEESSDDTSDSFRSPRLVVCEDEKISNDDGDLDKSPVKELPEGCKRKSEKISDNCLNSESESSGETQEVLSVDDELNKAYNIELEALEAKKRELINFYSAQFQRKKGETDPEMITKSERKKKKSKVKKKSFKNKKESKEKTGKKNKSSNSLSPSLRLPVEEEKQQKKLPQKRKLLDLGDYLPLDVSSSTKFGVAQIEKIHPYKTHDATSFVDNMLHGKRIKRFADSNKLSVYKAKQKAGKKAY